MAEALAAWETTRTPPFVPVPPLRIASHGDVSLATYASDPPPVLVTENVVLPAPESTWRTAGTTHNPPAPA